MMNSEQPIGLIDSLNLRVSKLEDWKIRIDIERAKEEVTRVHIDKRFDSIEASIDSFKGVVKWGIYLVVGSFIGSYVLPFVLKGGLVIPTIPH